MKAKAFLNWSSGKDAAYTLQLLNTLEEYKSLSPNERVKFDLSLLQSSLSNKTITDYMYSTYSLIPVY